MLLTITPFRGFIRCVSFYVTAGCQILPAKSTVRVLAKASPRSLLINACSSRSIAISSSLLIQNSVQSVKQPFKLGKLPERIKKSLFWIFSSRTKCLRSSYLLYTCCTDNIDVAAFFKEFQLPDTFLSWFIITELHLWMCQVRVAREEHEGRYMRNILVEALWKDVEIRLKKLGDVSASDRKEGKNELLEHYQAALFSYDEGLLSDDKVLAGALWRTFFSYNCVNASHLEKLVHYVRMQIAHLESIPSENILFMGKITWMPLKQANTVPV